MDHGQHLIMIVY